MTGPAISVLLPARNAAATLEEALGSTLAQTDAPSFEVVCVDDGSTDGTRALLEAHARRDARVRVIDGPARGLVAALNLGLAACRGALVARMDADDRMHPARLALQARRLDFEPSLGAVGSLVRIFPWPLSPGLARYQEWQDSVVTADECARARFIELPFVHPSLTFRRAALEAAGGWQDRGWPEDWDLVLRLWEQGHALAKVPEVLLWWRDGPTRLTRTGSAYTHAALRALRAEYLARGPLRGRPCVVWGAGPTGKRLARALEERGVIVTRFIDVSPRKREARGVPVEPPAALGAPGRALLIVAVGAAGARPTIRAELEPRGYQEGRDYFFAA